MYNGINSNNKKGANQIMFGKYYITNHALQRYEQRTNESKQSVQKRIMRDLNAIRNKKIVNIGPIKHIFYEQPSGNVREFILKQDMDRKDVFIVTTIINRSAEKNKIAYEKRLRAKKEYEAEKEGTN